MALGLESGPPPGAMPHADPPTCSPALSKHFQLRDQPPDPNLPSPIPGARRWGGGGWEGGLETGSPALAYHLASSKMRTLKTEKKEKKIQKKKMGKQGGKKMNPDAVLLTLFVSLPEAPGAWSLLYFVRRWGC